MQHSVKEQRTFFDHAEGWLAADEKWAWRASNVGLRNTRINVQDKTRKQSSKQKSLQ